MTRPPRWLATLLLCLTLALAGAAAQASARSSVSFTQIEQQFMCVDCHEALNVAQSQESFSERAYLRLLISQGLTAPQIRAQFVSAYGPAVLATPPASGFNLTIYILPPAIVVIGAVSLAVALPRWRRRTRAATWGDGGRPAPTPALSADDARRLDEDLARRA
ncbi:MAG: cytochrome c-type biogenesis protein CcmH [Actinomycetota bacterium]|nr:cytochrome c-type biogenesis protein CcmH [Actinomycetota bacterium]